MNVPNRFGVHLLVFGFTAAMLFQSIAVESRIETRKNLPIPGIDSVPADLRTNLIHRIKKYILADRNGDWPTLYDLKPAEMKTQESKEALIDRLTSLEKSMLLVQLVDLEPDSIQTLLKYDLPEYKDARAGSWGIFGCGLVKSSGKTTAYQIMFETRLANAEWYIAGEGPVANIDGPVHPCKFHKNRGLLYSSVEEK